MDWAALGRPIGRLCSGSWSPGDAVAGPWQRACSGIGGGAIIVPALATALQLLGFDDDVVQHVAVGTSLAIIIPTGIMSARAHHKRGALDVKTSGSGRR